MEQAKSTSIEYHPASSRNTLDFEDYASLLIETLTKSYAPKVLIDGICRIREAIMHNRVYTAPEALDDGADKNTIFDAFCNFESMTSEAVESSKAPWQQAAFRFFEDNR